VYGPKILGTLLILAALISMGLPAYSSREGSGAGNGLVDYFARLGFEVDLRAAVIAVGLIPVAWPAGFIIRTWSVK
jgi:hypothetical protein